MRRYPAIGMRLIGGHQDGEFRIGLCREGDEAGIELLGSGPSLVEALDNALQAAILVEEDWRRQAGDSPT